MILEVKNEYKGCQGIRNTSFMGRCPIWRQILDLICRKGLNSDFSRNLDPLGHTMQPLKQYFTLVLLGMHAHSSISGLRGGGWGGERVGKGGFLGHFKKK